MKCGPRRSVGTATSSTRRLTSTASPPAALPSRAVIVFTPSARPSRTSVLTGQYPHVGGHRTLDLPARLNEPNCVRALKDAGYETCLVGRNHVVDDETMPMTFDHWLRPKAGVRLDPPTWSCGVEGSYLYGRDDRRLEETSDYVRTAAACDWIERRDKSKPFFIWLNLEFPHPPYAVTAPNYGRIDRATIELPPLHAGTDKPPAFEVLRNAYGTDAMTEADWRELVAVYHEMCMDCDDRAKDLTDTLERLGLTDDTIFVHWADHGDFAGTYGLPEKWDTVFADCLTRVPLSMTGPGVPKVECDALVELIDVMPTLLELCDVDGSGRHARHVAGRPDERQGRRRPRRRLLPRRAGKVAA